MKFTWAVAAILLVPLVAALVPVPEPSFGIRASDVIPRAASEAQVLPGSQNSAFRDSKSPTTPRQPNGATPAPQPALQFDADGGIQLPNTAMAQLLGNLASEPGAANVHRSLLEYRSTLIAAAPPSNLVQFGENSSVAYSHEIGDVDRDGIGDLVLDIYCTAFAGCPDFVERIDTQAVRTTAGTYCSEPHILATVSGKDGRIIREQPLDVPHVVPPLQNLGCAIEFVVGTIPLEDSTRGVLIYRISVIEVFLGPERVQILHDLRLLDMKTGEPLWTKHEEGSYYWASGFFVGCTVVVVENLLLNPLLQEAPQRGLSPIPKDIEDGFFLQGVGFNATFCRAPQDAAGLTTGLWIAYDYRPNEWMARYDPRTGAQEWRVATFQPGDVNHSLLPRFLYQAPLGGNYPPADPNWDFNQVVHRHEHYWTYRGCCFDLTGDGRLDLAATTLEWSDTPSYNTDQLYGLRSRLIAFDGATGGRIYEQTLVADTNAPVIETTLEAVGDVDGDGTHDMAVHLVRFHPTFEHVLSIRSGGDGHELWRIENPRDLDILVVGDVDRDGGNDILLLEWPDWEATISFGRVITTPFANVTHHPLKIFSGRDGSLLWRGETFAAAVDVALLWANLRANGILDLNNDGVAEIPVDDPTMLPDRSVIHRISFIDPSTNKARFTVISAGAFAIPALASDVDGDGKDDMVLFNGDINDLWLTAHRSTDGEPIWARRLVSPRLSSTTQALPTLRLHDLSTPGFGGAMVLNFQMSYVTGGSLFFQAYLTQQILGVTAGNGYLVWAAPRMNQTDVDVVSGASPASAMFAKALDRQAHLMSAKIERISGLAWPGALIFLAAAAAGFFLVRRLRL